MQTESNNNYKTKWAIHFFPQSTSFLFLKKPLKAYTIYLNQNTTGKWHPLVTWEQNCAFSFGGSQCQLVEGHHLATCLQDPAASSVSDFEGTDLLWKNITSSKSGKFVPFVREDCTGNLAVSLGMSWILTSSVTVPTTTAVLFSRPGIFILRIWVWQTQSRYNHYTSSHP